MAGAEKDTSLALIAARDPQISGLVEQGFAFVTNTFKASTAPRSMQGKTDREQVRRLQQAGDQVEVTTGYDEPGQPRPTRSALWWKKRE